MKHQPEEISVERVNDLAEEVHAFMLKQHGIVPHTTVNTDNLDKLELMLQTLAFIATSILGGNLGVLQDEKEFRETVGAYCFEIVTAAATQRFVAEQMNNTEGHA